jgi:hypothetical protein
MASQPADRAPPRRRPAWRLQAGTVGNPPGPAPTGGQRQPAPIRFAGRASTTTRPFLLAGGLVVARAEHRGSGGFKVEVLDQDGAPQHVLFLATGRYRGSSGVGLRGGIYRLAVSGATPWKVQIDQPRGLTAAALPQRYRGTGDALVGHSKPAAAWWGTSSTTAGRTSPSSC